MSSSGSDTAFASTSSSSREYTIPCCTSCNGNGDSISYCFTCTTFLCARCDTSHKIIRHLKSHRISELNDIQNLDDLDDDKDNKQMEIKKLLLPKFWEANKMMNTLFQYSFVCKTYMEQMSCNRTEVLGFVNDLYRRCTEELKCQRDNIITSIDEVFTCNYQVIAERKLSLDTDGGKLLSALSNMKVVLETHGIEINGFQNGCFSNEFRGLDQWDVENGSLWEGISEATNYIYPVESSQNVLPLDSNSDSMSSITPAPSISQSVTSNYNPDCTPNSANTIQIYKTFGLKGNGFDQFNSPHGFCIGLDEDIVVADSSNHRVQIFDKTGSFKFQFGIAGRHDGYLWHPRKVALLAKKRQYVVCDRGYERSRMQIFTECGKFVKKIYIQYIDIVAAIAVTAKEDIILVNSVTPTIFIIGQNDFLRSIDCTKYTQEPSDIAVVGNEIYICDFKGHCVVVIDDEGNFLRKFGSKNTTVFPNGITVSPRGFVLIGDSHGNFFHLVIFTTNGKFLGEYRCPYIKVSRCCGLKITSEGRIVTVDKNYHHVIILDAQYVLN